MRWPIGIAIALAIVMAVNFAVAYIAVSGADVLDPTYATEAR